MKEIDHTTIDDLNQQFQDFQDDLMTREKKLKFIPVFDKGKLDDLIALLHQPDRIDFTPPKN